MPASVRRHLTEDKFIAGQLDVSSSVARFDGIAFVAAEYQT